MSVTIVTGGRDAGKTRWMRELAGRRSVWGFISPKHFADGAFAGYDLVQLPDGGTTPLARLGGPAAAAPGFAGGAAADVGAAGSRGAAAAAGPGSAREPWFRFRRFLFNQAAFDQAAEQAQRVLAGDLPDLETTLVLDEVGPLEVAGGGFRPVLDGFSAAARPLVVTTRPSLVAWLCELTGAARQDVIDLGS